MFTQFRSFLELIRFSHTLFALPFAMLAAALAWNVEPFRVLDLLGILLGMVFARSAAMAFNRLVDRRIDSANPRTQGRHLPAGKLSAFSVGLFTLGTSLAFLASTMLFLLREPANPWPMIFAVPVLLFLLGYSLAKRFTSLAHYWLGIALALAPLAAWIAVRGLVQLEAPALLAGAVLFWVGGFDILYACQDAEFDANAGLHSVPAKFGVKKSLRIAAVSHAVMFGFLIALGFVFPSLSWVYAVGLVGVAALLIVEHRLVKPDDLTRVNAAFFQVNGIISVGLLVVVVIELLSK